MTERLEEQVQRIRAVMDRTGLSEEEIADRIVLKRETMRKYAKGYQPASDRIMAMIENLPPIGERGAFDLVELERSTTEFANREALLQILGETSVTEEEAADRAGIVREEMAEYVAGKKPIPKKVLYRIQRTVEAKTPAKARKESAEKRRRGMERVKYDDSRILKVRQVPLLGWAQAGRAIDFEAVMDWDNFVTVEIDDPKAIAVRIRGDSMAPRYAEGDIVVLACSEPARNDDLVIAKLEGEGIVFKKLQVVDPERKLFRLISFNDKYAPIDRTADRFVWLFPVDSVIQKLRR